MTCTSPSPATLRRGNVPLFRQAFLQELIKVRTLEVATLDLIVGYLGGGVMFLRSISLATLRVVAIPASEGSQRVLVHSEDKC